MKAVNLLLEMAAAVLLGVYGYGAALALLGPVGAWIVGALLTWIAAFIIVQPIVKGRPS